MYVRKPVCARTHTLMTACADAHAHAMLVIATRSHKSKMYKDALSVGEMDEVLEPLGFVRQARTSENSENSALS